MTLGQIAGLIAALAAVVLVALQPQGGQFGQDVVGDPGGDQQIQPGARVVGEEGPGQFVADPFGGDDADAPGHVGHGGTHLVGDGESELGGEPGRPHHAQRVVAEGALWRERSAQNSRHDVGESGVGI